MKNNHLKPFGFIFVTFFLLPTFLAFFPSPLMAKEIRLGVAGVYSGKLAPYGISGLRGVQFAVRDINAGGGILGKKVVILSEDDGCKPKNASIKANKLIEENVCAVIGHICSGATKAALSAYKESEIIVMSPSATNPELTQSGKYPNFFRTIASDDMQAKVEVKFALENLKLKKIAVLHDKGVYGKGLAEQVKKMIEKSKAAEIVLFEGITPEIVNYSALVHKVKRSGADGIIFGGYHPGASKIVLQLRKKKMNIVFLSDDGVKDATFIRETGKYAEGVYATAPMDTSSNPLAKSLEKDCRDAYGSPPGPFFLNAYAATIALSKAFHQAGSTDYKAVLKALRNISVETPIGTIGFDEKGDATGVGFSVYQVQNGTFIEVKRSDK